MVSEETGQNKDDVHDFYCQKFLSQSKEVFGEKVLTRGTSKLSTVDFEKFMLNVRTHAQQELSIFIPLPGEIIYEE
jgi:hypothetical protein